MLVVAALLVAGVLYLIIVRVFSAVIAHDWTELIFVIAFAVLFGILGWLMVVSVMLTFPEAAYSLAPTMVAAGWAVIYVAVPSFLGVWAVTPAQDGHPRALGLGVRGVVVRRLRRRSRGGSGTGLPAFNPLALISPWISILVPFGMIIAVIARQQIRQADSTPGQQPQRGIGATNVAMILTVIFFALFIAAAWVVAAIDPRDLTGLVLP